MNTLTQELVKELFDYRDGELYWKVKSAWRIKVGDVAGFASKNSRYRSVHIKNKTYLVHRVVYLYHHGNLPEFLDHANGDSFDNRIENLREATKAENNRNAKTRKDNTSGHKGVSWHKRTKKWMVRVRISGKYEYIGSYSCLELAGLVSQEVRDLYYGKFAKHD